jgi:hypothetical protein
MTRIFRVRVTSAAGDIYADLQARNQFEAGCAALDRYPAAFCAEAVREVQADEPAIMRRQAE